MSIDFGVIKRFYLCVIFLNFLYINRAADKRDAKLTTPELIKKYGYTAEVHYYLTKDDFVLCAHRIARPGKQPVMLMHGLMGTSADWIIREPKRGLGYLLSNRGYDVWLLNVRGNRYSRRSAMYSRSHWKFWDFSFHEIGILDLPAAIDYILEKTEYEQIHYVGYSQGTTAFFVMGSERPEYMKKIKSMHALAPVVFFNHIKNEILELVAPYGGIIYSGLKCLGINEVLSESYKVKKFLYKYCRLIFGNTCLHVVFEMMGMDIDQFDQSFVPVLLGHSKEGTSLKSLVHYAQQYKSGGFYQFRYEKRSENKRQYGTYKVPKYKLYNVDCKVALYYGKDDGLAPLKDVRALRDSLPNVIHDQLINYRYFNHIDFMMANDVRKFVYDDLMEVMEKVDAKKL